MPQQNETEWATIGNVVAPFGVRGEIKVRPLTDIPDRFTSLDTVSLGPDHLPYVIENVRPYKGEMVVLKLKGIEDANAVEALRNFSLEIPIDQLAVLPPDSYYQHDILGLQVFTMSNRDVGTIVDIMTAGGNDVYIIRTPERKQVMIPSVKQVIKQIDLVRRTMYIDPLPGLLDEDEAILDTETEEQSSAEGHGEEA